MALSPLHAANKAGALLKYATAADAKYKGYVKDYAASLLFFQEAKTKATASSATPAMISAMENCVFRMRDTMNEQNHLRQAADVRLALHLQQHPPCELKQLIPSVPSAPLAAEARSPTATLQSKTWEAVGAELSRLNLNSVDCGGQGDCLPNSLAYSLGKGRVRSPDLRLAAQRQLRAFPEIYRPFFNKQDSGGCLTFESFADSIGSPGVWGNHVFLQALADLLRLEIRVVNHTLDVAVIHPNPRAYGIWTNREDNDLNPAGLTVVILAHLPEEHWRATTRREQAEPMGALDGGDGLEIDLILQAEFDCADATRGAAAAASAAAISASATSDAAWRAAAGAAGRREGITAGERYSQTMLAKYCCVSSAAAVNLKEGLARIKEECAERGIFVTAGSPVETGDYLEVTVAVYAVLSDADQEACTEVHGWVFEAMEEAKRGEAAAAAQVEQGAAAAAQGEQGAAAAGQAEKGSAASAQAEQAAAAAAQPEQPAAAAAAVAPAAAAAAGAPAALCVIPGCRGFPAPPPGKAQHHCRGCAAVVHNLCVQVCASRPALPPAH